MSPRTLAENPRTGLFEEKRETSPDSGTLRDHDSSNEHMNGGGELEDTEDHTNNDKFASDERSANGGEKGKDSNPLKPVGFWDKRMKKVRLQVFGLWARTVLILSTFILAVLSMYWAVLFHVPQNTSSLNVIVVDFDGRLPPYTGVTPLIGPLLTKTAQKQLSGPIPHLGFVTRKPSEFNNDPMKVRQAIHDWDAWVGIVVNANATALLQQAVEQGNTSYDPLGTAQIYYVEARDQDTYRNYVLPQISSLETELISTFGQIWTRQVLANNSIPRTTLERAPQALSPAIGFSQYNLRPFGPPVTTPAVTIGLIYLIIISFFTFSFFMPIHMKFMDTSSDHPPLKFWQFVLWRWIATIIAYLLMSLAYSVISRAFQIPFGNPAAPGTEVANNPDAYGKGTFPVYWMINYVGMIALGVACENVAMVIGQPWTALWLIFWVITNVATSFYSLDLSPKWYYWGYAWPLHNIVEASRSTLFDLHSRIGLNFGVLFVWAAINTVLFPFCCFFMKKMTGRQKKEAGQEKKD